MHGFLSRLRAGSHDAPRRARRNYIYTYADVHTKITSIPLVPDHSIVVETLIAGFSQGECH